MDRYQHRSPNATHGPCWRVLDTSKAFSRCGLGVGGGTVAQVRLVFELELVPAYAA